MFDLDKTSLKVKKKNRCRNDDEIKRKGNYVDYLTRELDPIKYFYTKDVRFYLFKSEKF